MNMDELRALPDIEQRLWCSHEEIMGKEEYPEPTIYSDAFHEIQRLRSALRVAAGTLDRNAKYFRFIAVALGAFLLLQIAILVKFWP